MMLRSISSYKGLLALEAEDISVLEGESICTDVLAVCICAQICTTLACIMSTCDERFKNL